MKIHLLLVRSLDVTKEMSLLSISLLVFLVSISCSMLNSRLASEAVSASTPTTTLTVTGSSTLSHTAVGRATQIAMPTMTSSPIFLQPTFTQSYTPTGTPSPPPQACIPNDAEVEYGLVLWVSDGDSIVVDIQGRISSVRYLGIDAPAAGRLAEPYGMQAKAFNASLVAGHVAYLFRDVSDRDRFGQLLRYVVVNDFFMNYELVRQGFAQATFSHTDMACEVVIVRAEQSARAEGLGMWSIPPTATQTLTRTITSTVISATPTSSPTETNPPTGSPTATPTPTSSPTINPTIETPTITATGN